MNIWIIISSIITAIATGVIAWFAWRSHQISREIIKLTRGRNEEDATFKQEIKDFYQAIVVSNILSAPGIAKDLDKQNAQINTFKKLYNGKTNIFEDEEK